MVSDDPMRHPRRNTLAGPLLSGLPHKPSDRYPHNGPHPLASLSSLVIDLRCSWCPGNAPMPVLTGLHAVQPAAGRSTWMSMEFLHGRPLSPEELDMIRQQIEEGFDNIAEIDPEIRGIVARNWPHLLSKLPPEED
jgi:hypothetical protein